MVIIRGDYISYVQQVVVVVTRIVQTMEDEVDSAVSVHVDVVEDVVLSSVHGQYALAVGVHVLQRTAA